MGTMRKAAFGRPFRFQAGLMLAWLGPQCQVDNGLTE
jgi:hypothetical protein